MIKYLALQNTNEEWLLNFKHKLISGLDKKDNIMRISIKNENVLMRDYVFTDCL